MTRSLPWGHVHFIGAGGVGMAGLAQIAADLGVIVSGSDSVDSRNLQLLAQGGSFAVGHRVEQVTTPDLVVISSAIPETNAELAAARERGLPVLARGAFLAVVAEAFERVICVAGSHGKTTVTAMVAQILQQAGMEPGFLVGGDFTAGGRSASAGQGQILVTEVDESDGSQSLMRCTHAVVVNVDDDHCWSLGGEEALYQCFRTFAERAGRLITWESEMTRMLFGPHPDVSFLDDTSLVSLPPLQLAGRHNRMDAALAVRVACEVGVAPDEAHRAIAGFRGVDRRLTVRHSGSSIVIEDYAHHPVEVRAAIAALREAYPEQRLRVIFQPHRFERVARYAADFARELSAADEVVVTEPFSAWLDDRSLADPRSIVAQLTGPPARYSDESYPELARALAVETKRGDIIAVVGAGTITKLVGLLTAELARRESITEGVENGRK